MRWWPWHAASRCSTYGRLRLLDNHRRAAAKGLARLMRPHPANRPCRCSSALEVLASTRWLVHGKCMHDMSSAHMRA